MIQPEGKLEEMSRDLDRLRARWGGQRGVVTKYTREAKSLLDKELIEDALSRLELISKTLKEKCALLQTLHESS